jgi:AbrB family looped-hinge helix DNA binding protein
MKVSSKGQVTIPKHIRQILGITGASEIDFIEENGLVYLVKRKTSSTAPSNFAKLRGISTVKMTTEEIMTLTRAD